MPESEELSSEITIEKSQKRSSRRDRVYMLNVVWFKKDGGELRYREYLRLLAPLIAEVGGRKLKSFVPGRELIGEFDADLMYFVEYPNWQAFKDVANSANYHKFAYIREEALEKQLLIRCSRPGRSFWS